MENDKIVNKNDTESKMKLKSPFSPKLIYVFTVNDKAHSGKVKIGETLFTGHFKNEEIGYGNISDDSNELNENARKRIDQYTKTVGVKYNLLYTTIAIGYKDGKCFSFGDKKVHEVLKRSGINCVHLTDRVKNQSEWFEISLETAKNAIKVVKEGRDSLNPNEIVATPIQVVLRSEQREAINKAKQRFSKEKKFLWNCKMRFGKTISALTLIKEMEYKRAIIITHRPAVNDGWYDDFKKVFFEEDTPYVFASKNKGEKSLNTDKSLVYFASIQDLRGSDEVGGNFEKNIDVFNTNWDLVVIDEAHEGTQTEKGQDVINALIKENTKVLSLSGTPFNLLEKGEYADDEIYTWDYIQEQKAKSDWEKNHPLETNPYAILPRMNIRTYDLEEELKLFVEDDYFNFSEFFRVDDNSKFVYEENIKQFLDMLCTKSDTSNYPFSNEEYRSYFRHTFWVLPGVKEAHALEGLLKTHSVFGEGAGYKIINVAGDGSDDVVTSRAYEEVRKATEENEYTITLSCGRLTTGVTIPNWTAVFMLYGSFLTSCSSYMQTIFRVQSPAVINGKIKTDCYVFDFAPDRTLKLVAESIQKSHRNKKGSDINKLLGDFLNFCPIISEKGSILKEYDANILIETLNKVRIENVVKNGFEARDIYNNDYLNTLDEKQKELLNKINDIIGQTKAQAKTKKLDLAKTGLTNPEMEELNNLEEKTRDGDKNKKGNLSEEEKKRLEELRKRLKEQQKEKEKAIRILRGISIRIPLLMYGASLKNDESEDEALTVDNFTSLIDDDSWNEFMPQGITKEMFDNGIKESYDKDVFLSASKRIRQMARSLDKEGIENRIKQLSDIFSTFRNPDKETVLTPWRVVNMHLGDTFGGWNFYDEEYKKPIEDPRFINMEGVTDKVFSADSKVLEINSKTGLYPLYVAYSIFKERAKTELVDKTFKGERELWKKVIAENIFVLCKSKMAKEITYRTLLGFERGEDKANLKFEENLISKVKEGSQIKSLCDKLHKTQTWSAFKKTSEEENVNFTCVVGNPPYQMMDGGAQASAGAIYNYYYNLAEQLDAKCIDLIMPSRWMTGGKGLEKFRSKMLKNTHIRILHDHINSNEVFSNVDIKGGICYFLYDKDYTGECSFFTYASDSDKPYEHKRYLSHENNDVVIRDSRMASVLDKVHIFKEKSFAVKVSPLKPYGLRGDTFTAGPEKYHLPPFSDTPIEGGYKILGRSDGKRVYKYVPKDYPFPKKDGLDKYKIFISESYGCGEIGEGPATPVLATPGEACSETFVQVYVCENRNEVSNALKYIKTKLFRMLVGIKKISQHATSKVYNYVPLQDFTDKSDIDWSVSVSEIDKQLYKKYGLSDEDIAFIESNVKPME